MPSQGPNTPSNPFADLEQDLIDYFEDEDEDEDITDEDEDLIDEEFDEDEDLEEDQ